MKILKKLLLSCFMFLLLQNSNSSAFIKQSEDDIVISQISPSKGFSVVKGSVRFQWKISSSDINKIDRFVVSIWSDMKKSVQFFTVKPESGKVFFSYTIDEIRQICPRHGQYYWKVALFLKSGGKIETGSRRFRVKPWTLQKEKNQVSNIYPYGMEFAYFHRLNTDEQKQFKKTVLTDLLFRSYSEVRFVFYQHNIWELPVTLCEKVKLLMLPGVGLDLCGKIHLISNKIFTLSPRFGITGSCAATSVAETQSILYFYYIGSELSFMPGGYLTLIGDYIPEYNMPYQTETFKVLTFKGSGYRYGIRYFFSQRFMPAWKIGKLKVDMRRVPIEFFIEIVKDDYTGTTIKTRKISLGYFF